MTTLTTRLARWFACLALLVCAAPANAQTVTIKLGTLAPDGSAWHQLLKQMGDKWSEVSGGKVKLKVFPGGVAGNEGDMVRKMRINQLQAAALTVVGLHDIETSAQAIATPGLITDQEEWEHVFAKMQPIWQPRFEEKGFVPLMWGDTGWVQLFTTRELTTSQLKGLKVFAWAGDPSSVKAWELAGFQPVVISATDILPSLSTGMIEGVANTPIMAFTARWYERAKFMPDAAWGHLPGATIVNKATWEKIPADLRPKLAAVAQEFGVKVNTEVTKMQADALAQMQKNGLKIVKLSPEEKALWQKNAEKTWAAMRGGVVSAEHFDEVKRLRDEYRASKGKK